MKNITTKEYTYIITISAKIVKNNDLKKNHPFILIILEKPKVSN